MKVVKPWEQRPFPKHGESDPDKVYVAVGRALSEWERFETYLGLLFAKIVSEQNIDLPAQRAYAAVRTFEARSAMLKTASAAFFLLYHGRSEVPTLQAAFKKMIGAVCEFGARRNEIAHGVVARFEEPGETYGLFPPYGAHRQRDVYGRPTYCYTSTELEHFRAEFEKLKTPVGRLIGDFQSFDRHKRIAV